MPQSSGLRLISARQLLEEQERGTLLLDARTAEQFAELHARGAIQIGLLGPFASWAAILFEPGQEILLVVEDARGALEAHVRLARVGLARVIGYSLADPPQWRRAGVELANVSVVRCAEILDCLQSDTSLQLVDVRSRAEWLQGHLPRALSLPLLDLTSDSEILPPSARPLMSKRSGDRVAPARRSFLYCREGFRATTAASLLLRANVPSIGILIDGVEGWSKLGLQLHRPRDWSGQLTLAR